jgi:AhpD family alkylhydroperoxidase
MPTPYRYTTPVPKTAATGQVADVYAQIAAEFILTDGPLMSLSPAPDLLAVTWALLREAQLAGRAPRVNKEAVATAVSAVNRCQFCVDAHTALVHAAGEHQLAEALWHGERPSDPDMAALVAWARATIDPTAAALPAPFPDELTAEYLGTTLVTHFINHVVSAMLHESLLPGGLGRSRLVRRVAGKALGRAVQRQVHPGGSLPLLATMPIASEPPWAEGTPIGIAFAALSAVAGAGGSQLSTAARQRVQRTIAGWDGATSALTWGQLEQTLGDLSGADRAGARIALLAALAPHEITDADVAAWRVMHPSDASLVRLVAFGAMAAIERIEERTTAAWYPAAPLAIQTA